MLKWLLLKKNVKIYHQYLDNEISEKQIKLLYESKN